MDSPQDTAALPAVGFPIRTSTDQSLVGGSPWLIAATHVLHRLLEPRHPPHALSSLVTLNSGLPSRCSSGALFEVEIQTFGVRGSHEDLAVRCSITLRIRLSECFERGLLRRAPGLEFPACSGGADRSRTDDIQLAKLALYQLSYSPIKRCAVGIWWA
jgi:hypothetical protein